MSEDYQQLQSDIGEWIDRDDLATKIPTFIRMALHRINRKLRILDMEEIASTPLSAVNYFYGLPPRFQEMRNIYINTSPERKLTYVTPKQMNLRVDNNDPLPSLYTLVDGAIKLNKANPDNVGYSLMINFYQGYAMFAQPTDTNWLILNVYDLILYGSLIAAEGFIMTDERIPVWKSQFEETISELNEAAENARYSGDDLRIRSV